LLNTADMANFFFDFSIKCTLDAGTSNIEPSKWNLLTILYLFNILECNGKIEIIQNIFLNFHEKIVMFLRSLRESCKVFFIEIILLRYK
jgi:hypothetical protein